jgi:hypothetical protein
MDLTINLTGVQENSKYVLEFSLTRDGKVIVTNGSDSPPSNNDGKPSLEDIEENNKPTLGEPPSMDDIKPKKSYKDYKIKSEINLEENKKK